MTTLSTPPRWSSATNDDPVTESFDRVPPVGRDIPCGTPTRNTSRSTIGRALAKCLDEAPQNVATQPAPNVDEDAGLLVARRLSELRRIVAETPVPAEPVESAGAERRTFPRRESGCRVTVATLDGPAHGRTHDWRLRADGRRGDLVDLGLPSSAIVLQEPIAEGTRIVVRLEHVARGASRDVTGVVGKCIEADGSHRIVVQHDERLTLDDVHTFGHAAPSFV